jgi:hypothetical protein
MSRWWSEVKPPEHDGKLSSCEETGATGYMHFLGQAFGGPVSRAAEKKSEDDDIE